MEPRGPRLCRVPPGPGLAPAHTCLCVETTQGRCGSPTRAAAVVQQHNRACSCLQQHNEACRCLQQHNVASADRAVTAKNHGFGHERAKNPSARAVAACARSCRPQDASGMPNGPKNLKSRQKKRVFGVLGVGPRASTWACVRSFAGCVPIDACPMHVRCMSAAIAAPCALRCSTSGAIYDCASFTQQDRCRRSVLKMLLS